MSRAREVTENGMRLPVLETTDDPQATLFSDHRGIERGAFSSSGT